MEKDEKNEKEQEDLNSENRKQVKREDVKNTPQVLLVTGFETIRVRIKTELMSDEECERLKRIAVRDTRIIRDYLRLIFHYEDRQVFYKGKLVSLVKPNGKVNKSLLDHLTLSTSMNSEEHKTRSSVPHNFKKRYPHCSHDEFQECRNKATRVYKSWKALQCISSTEVNRPQFDTKTPRQINKGLEHRGTLQVLYEPKNTKARLWLNLRDSLDSKRESKRYHAKLSLPLAYSPYHEKKLKPDDIKTVELVYQSDTKEWSAHFMKEYAVPRYQSSNPPAVLGIDLGIKKPAVAVVLNSTGRVTMDEIRFIRYPAIHTDIYWLKKRITSIQNKLDVCLKAGKHHNQLNVKLSQLRQKLSSMVKQELGCLVNHLVDFILQMSQRYNLFVSIGYPKDIKNSNKRGRVNKALRRQLHDWSYRSFITTLKFKLHKQGFEHFRVVAVGERETSKTCSKCQSKNTRRFKQGRFVCRQCNYEINADLNGARNMAKRLITYVLEPSVDFKRQNVLQDYLSRDFHNLKKYGDFHPLSQWLKYSSGDTSFL